MCKQEQAASEDLGDLQPPLLEKEASVHQNQYRYIYIWYYCQHRYVVKECSIDPSPQDQLFLDPVRMSALVPSLMNKGVFGRAPLQLFQLHFKNSTMELGWVERCLACQSAPAPIFVSIFMSYHFYPSLFGCWLTFPAQPWASLDILLGCVCRRVPLQTNWLPQKKTKKARKMVHEALAFQKTLQITQVIQDTQIGIAMNKCYSESEERVYQNTSMTRPYKFRLALHGQTAYSEIAYSQLRRRTHVSFGARSDSRGQPQRAHAHWRRRRPL